MMTSRTRTRSLLAVLATLACLAGCSRDATGPSRDRLKDTIATERRQWELLNLKSYELELTVWCGGTTCPAPKDRVHVTVKDGSVESINQVSDGKWLDPTFYTMVRSVDGMFALLQDALDSNADSILAGFDPQYHFPTTIQIDPKASVKGDEVSYTVVKSTFKPSP